MEATAMHHHPRPGMAEGGKVSALSFKAGHTGGMWEAPNIEKADRFWSIL